MAAKKVTRSQILKMKRCITDAENNLENKNEFVYSEFVFHKRIFETANNKILNAVMDSLNALLLVLEKYEKDYIDIEDRKQSLLQHKKIFEAISQKDLENARLAMYNHLNSMEERLKKMEESVTDL